MKNSIDKGFITDEFLLGYFSYKSRFHHPFDRGLAFSKELYIKFKTNLNQQRTKSGHSPLSDADLSKIIIEYFNIKNNQ